MVKVLIVSTVTINVFHLSLGNAVTSQKKKVVGDTYLQYWIDFSLRLISRLGDVTSSQRTGDKSFVNGRFSFAFKNRLSIDNANRNFSAFRR